MPWLLLIVTGITAVSFFSNNNPSEILISAISLVEEGLIVTEQGLKTVYSDSVAQFVGYDADNAEVYEGDVLVSEEGHEYIATLDSMLLWTKDPQIKYWHVPFNQSDDETLPTSSNKLLWDFYKNCCEKMTHTKFLRLKKE